VFRAERAIIQRLDEEVVGLKTCGSMSLLASSRDMTDLLPGIFVGPGSGDITEGGRGYGVTGILQSWSVTIIVPHWRTVRGDSSAAQLAGPFMMAVLAALEGWSPGTGFEPMVFEGYGAPVGNAGWAAFDMDFSLQFSFP